MKNPFITMSAVTGRPTRDEIFTYMGMLKSGGIDQVMVYPRRGCEVEYLSDEWFTTVENFLHAAEKYDMYIYLNDDFHFPSGEAGGKVPAVEKFRLKMIDTDGNIAYQTYGEDKYFPDLLCKEAVDYFIECTHANYYNHFGEYFGKIIKGFYTDEPAIAHCCKNGAIPYYVGMEEDYKTETGRNFLNDLKNADKTFYKIAYGLLSDKFRKSFTESISSWCVEHDVVLTGHLYEDDNPFTGTMENGNLLKNLSAFSMPGIDDIFTDFKKDLIYAVLGVGEYARKNHKCMMSELFALGPCDMSFSKKNCAIHLAACFKVNTYVLAIAPMDFRANTLIRGYFSPFTADQPDFMGMNILAESAVNAAKYADKDYTPDVYIKYPYEICAMNVPEGVNVKAFYDLLNILVYRQIQWKYIDAEDAVGEDIPVIDFTEDVEYIFNGNIYKNADKLCDELNIPLCVTDAEGNLPAGIFVRHFNDETFVVLNLYGESGVYKLYGKEFYLYKHGVYTSDTSEEIAANKKSKMNVEFDVRYYNDNMIRTMYIDDEKNAVVQCENDTEITFAVRNGTEVFLNDEKLMCKNNADTLPSGFRKLYKMSDKIILKKGDNILRTTDDCKFLPNVFIKGDFSVKLENSEVCTVKILPRVKKVTTEEQFSDFGKIEFCTQVEVPEGVKGIELVDSNLYTTLYIDNKCIGEKIFAPYVYEIDESLWNKKVDMIISQSSSLGPVFGDIGYHDANSESVTWKGNPPLGTTLFGFNGINWVY